MGQSDYSPRFRCHEADASVLSALVRTSQHSKTVRVALAAVVLLVSFTMFGTRPAAAAAPAARVHAYGVPAFPDLATASKPVVGITATPSGSGYWLVATDGGIFGYGGAPFFGSTGGVSLSKPVVGMAATPSGLGYWLVASDGGIFAYGDAAFFGSTGGIPLSQPVVGMASTPTGRGYWLVARDGGIFAYGDAAFFGSTGGLPLARPVVGMAATVSGGGYWLVAGDGGIFAFGSAQAMGSVPGTGASVSDVVGMARTPTGGGYVVVGRKGQVWAFGGATYLGAPVLAANRVVVGVATAGGGYWLADADAPPPPSVGPALPAGSGDGRRIVYCVSCQRVWFVEGNGAVVKSFPVSGRVATPRAGTYSVFSKSRLASSGSVTMEYMVRFAHGRSLAIGFHAIPRTRSGAPIQSEAQLGTFRSHGCVRQADRDALATWNFAPVGTKVVVTA